MLLMYSVIESSQPNKVGTTLLTILQLRKPSPEEVKSLAQDHTAREFWNRIHIICRQFTCRVRTLNHHSSQRYLTDETYPHSSKGSLTLWHWISCVTIGCVIHCFCSSTLSFLRTGVLLLFIFLPLQPSTVLSITVSARKVMSFIKGFGFFKA